MEKSNILLIGTGELGSRHLQGLLKSSNKFNIYCIDPSQKSLDLAITRAEEVVHSHKVHFLQSIEGLPNNFFLAIIATSANIRESVVLNILDNFTISNIILEKVVFQQVSSFEVITKKLLEINNCNVWVNHPRRMFSHYKKIKNLIKKSDSKIQNITISGSGWGLACNSLHYIDLCEYLDDSNIVSLSSEKLNDKIYESKREGFIEFSGEISGYLNTGAYFLIKELQNTSSTNITIAINTDKYIWIVQEGVNPYIIEINNSNFSNSQISEYSNAYQSSLTTIIVDDIYENDKCELTPYADSALTHKIFINSFLLKYNQITSQDNLILPIT